MRKLPRKPRKPAEPELTPAQQQEILDRVDPKLCFVCQGAPPTFEMLRGDGKKFKVCDECKLLVEQGLRVENKIRQALGRERLFTYTLGLDTTPRRATFTPIKEEKS